MDIGGALGNIGTIEGLIAKKTGEMLFGTTNKSDTSKGGKKKYTKNQKNHTRKHTGKHMGKKIKNKSTGGDDIVEEEEVETQNLDPWKEISNAIFSGGNKKEQTFLENEFNYPLMILGLLILLKIYKDNN
tara:strand:- start:2964 stop:3353 length:390 start_codon:yes stop_codon:yes gene_type:complete